MSDSPNRMWIVFGDVVRTLEDLAADGFKLGIISDWDDRLLLKRLRLDRYFESIIVSATSASQNRHRSFSNKPSVG